MNANFYSRNPLFLREQ